MQIGTVPNSLLDSRWASARQLTEDLGHPPTQAELSELWGTTKTRTNAILLVLRSRGAEIPIIPTPPPPSLADKKAARMVDIDNLTKSYGRPPTRSELSKLWGVNRSRVGRVLEQIARDQAESASLSSKQKSKPLLNPRAGPPIRF
jgi:hypothetical protein